MREPDTRHEVLPTPRQGDLAIALSSLALVASLTATGAQALQGTNTVDSGDIKNGQVKAADVATGGVAGAEVADGRVRAADIATNGVGSTEVADGQVRAAEMATGGVASDEVADGTLDDEDVGERTFDFTAAIPSVAAHRCGYATISGLGPVRGDHLILTPDVGIAGADLIYSVENTSGNDGLAFIKTCNLTESATTAKSTQFKLLVIDHD
ncbi:MAG: hypothetical protein H0U12_00225 [Thermoleophilaceae bacterium]|nr:hypothetical protein [Thermoleophilaceae bacterium]